MLLLIGYILIYSFPKDETLKNKWILATKRKDFKPSLAVLCSQHFDPDAFEVGGIRKRLKKNAIPTIFDFPPHFQTPKPKVRRVLIRPEVSKTYNIFLLVYKLITKVVY